MSQMCSNCMQLHRKTNPSWGTRKYVETPGCPDCQWRYEAKLSEVEGLEAKLARKASCVESIEQENVILKRMVEEYKLSAKRQETQLLQQANEIQALKAEILKLKSEYEQEQRRSAFLIVCHDYTKIEGSDVTFHVEGIKMFAHRAILGPKSDVFKVFFQRKDLWNESSQPIEISHFSYPVILAVINFCYTAEITFTENVDPEKTLQAAHEYQIGLLKKICEVELCGRLSVVNAPQLLKLALRIDAPILRKATAKFFKENFDVLESSVFETLDGP